MKNSEISVYNKENKSTGYKKKPFIKDKQDGGRENRGLAEGLISGTFSLTLSAIIVKIIGLVYKIPLASLLGDEGMGYFNSAYTVFAFFYLLCTAGVPKAVMILVSEAKARGLVKEEERIVKIATWLFLAIGGGLTLIFILFAAPISRLIGNSKAYATMIAIAPSVVMLALSGVIRGQLSANMKLLDISVSQVIEGLSKLCLGLVFAMLGHRLDLPVEILSALTILGVTFGSFFGLLYLFICSKIKIKKENIGQIIEKQGNRKIARRILSISIPITISAAIMSVTNIIDLGLIMRSLEKIGYEENLAASLYGNYTTLAVPMFNLAISVISPISVAFLPIFTRQCISSHLSALKRTERSAIELTSVIASPMMIGMLFFAEEILALLFPMSEIKVGARLLCLIAPAILFSSLLLVVNTLLEAKGRVRAPLLSMLIGSIAKIVVSIFLITRTELQILGAPIGTVVSYAVALIVSIIYYGIVFGSHIPLFSASFMPYLNGFVAVFASRIVFDKLSTHISQNLSLLISITLAALIYLIISAATGILAPKRIREMAKYTKLS